VGRLRFVACAVVWTVGAASASTTLTISNGVTGDHALAIDLDDYGAYGTGIGPQEQDHYTPAGQVSRFATWMAGAYLFVTTPSDGMRTAMVLTEYKKWIQIETPGGAGTGVIGDRALVLGIMTPNTMVGPDHLTSVFTAGEPNAGPVQLQIALDQKLTWDAATMTTTFRQTYTITNTGSLDTNLGFHAHWDADLIWTDQATDDIGGVGQGRCYIYIRDMDQADDAVALRDGGSTTPRTFYYVGKGGVLPGMGPPTFQSTYYSQDVFNGFGMPPTWQNDLATIGYNVAGETPTIIPMGTGNDTGNAAMGAEYRFALPIGATHTIVLDRIYGTSSLTCPTPPPGCGDGVVNGNEQCDTFGADTTTCVGATCQLSVCGDGYVNMAAGEVCDSSGVDTASCVGTTCQLSACGDGYVNAAAGEECDSGALCDATTCKAAYTVGGGCAGCAGNDGRGGWWLALAVAAVLARRRR
jgi:hypothetical protein